MSAATTAAEHAEGFTMPGAQLELTGVSKRFGPIRAVDRVSFGVAPGELLALLGANGAGKSTLFEVIGGQQRATEGRIVLGGTDITRRSAHAIARMGLLRSFQVAKVFDTYTVRQNIVLSLLGASSRAFGLRGALRISAAERAGVDSALERAGLGAHADRPCAGISESDRKRLDIARVLVRPAKVVLLDEPTAGLSTEDIDRMITLIRQLRRDQPDLSIVLTAHDMNVVRQLADRALLLVGGRGRVAGPVVDVLRHPETISTYLGESDGE
ncbi:ABC transporter ATP-binding protein [Actinacidiphila sp. ITFR-21]|uniref:ABC transporter ATP-binding protein n=1 Tax=Actinacidiphila sp. ITFR-21 TaxID=3075199 RepID=UPI00288A8F2B|nr:ATP-binding cassette domain-containing protein [Streptomyces sp. ITFR-21]WNI19004.1 ATP-binding cassette domain-containing protein [Streptomyces sp. ITFR-21]